MNLKNPLRKIQSLSLAALLLTPTTGAFAQTLKAVPEPVLQNVTPGVSSEDSALGSAPLESAPSLSPDANASLGSLSGLAAPESAAKSRSESARPLSSISKDVRGALKNTSKLEAASGERAASAGTDVIRALAGGTVSAPSSEIETAGAISAVAPSIPSAPSVSVVSASGSSNRNGRSAWSTALRPFRAFAFAAALGLGTFAAPPAALADPTPAVQVDASKKADYYRASDINDLVNHWSPSKHVYVLGDVGLSEASLRSLEAALKDTHWTVVLVKDASGQKYTTSDGRTYYDKDAVDYATGQGLPKAAGWSSLTDSRTGESDAAHITIVLQQHGLYYQGSDEQNHRGLGKEHFQGNLDQWAISAMRDGMKIQKAVVDTINNIDAKVDASVEGAVTQAKTDIDAAKAAIAAYETKTPQFAKDHPEKASAFSLDTADMKKKLASAQAALDSKKPAEASRIANDVLAKAQAPLGSMDGYSQKYSSAKADVGAAETQVASLEKELGDFKRANPKATGALSRPGLTGMKDQLSSARQALSSGDVASASSKAAQVIESAKGASKLLADYPAGASALEGVEAKLGALKGRSGASSASSEIQKAKDALADARQAYDTGASDYSQKIDAAASAAQQAQDEVGSAETKAAAFRFMLLLIASLATLGLALLVFFMHRRVIAPRENAKKLLGEWKTALDEKLQLAFKQLQDRADKWCETHPWEQESAALAKQTKEDVDYANILWGSAKYVFEQAEALSKPSMYNWFFPDRLQKAERLLDEENGEKITFNPDDEEGLRLVFGQSDVDKKKLYGKLKDFKRWESSLSDLMKEYNARTERADKALDELEKSVFGAPAAFEKTDKSIADAGTTKEKLIAAGSDGLFLAPSIYAALLTSASADLAKSKAAVANNPIGAMKNSGTAAGRKAQEALDLANAILEARGNPLKIVYDDLATLKAGGMKTAWIDKELQRLSGAAETLAANGVNGAIAEGIQNWKKEVGALASRAARAAEIEKAYRENALPSIQSATEDVAKARTELGSALGLEADKMLREKDFDPTDHLAKASERAEAAKTAIGNGDTAAAEKALDESARFHDEAVGIVEASRKAFKDQEETVTGRRAETNRIEGLVPQAEATLDKIEKKFAPSVLLLGSGDAAHPSANGTIGDNIEETNEQLAFAKQKLDKAVSEYRAGRLLSAANLLRQIAAHHEFALHRLGEISDKDARLTAALASNAALLTALDKTVIEYKRTIVGDMRVMRPTIDAYEKAARQVTAARATVEAKKGDPFQAETELKSAEAVLAQIKNVLARNDIDVYEEADRSLKAAASQLDSAKGLERKARTDDVPDSPEITADYRKIAALDGDLTRAQGSFREEHGDWHAVDHEADRITAEAGRVAASLRGELQHAQDAVAAISSAASSVRQAGSWSGGHGVYIPGSPGSSELENARGYLQQGRYADAQQAASRAASIAASAIAEAEAEVARREEEERRKREEERRRREEEEAARRRRAEEERSSYSSGSGSSWGSSSSGNGGSSYSSSGSGNGSSSW